MGEVRCLTEVHRAGVLRSPASAAFAADLEANLRTKVKLLSGPVSVNPVVDGASSGERYRDPETGFSSVTRKCVNGAKAWPDDSDHGAGGSGLSLAPGSP